MKESNYLALMSYKFNHILLDQTKGFNNKVSSIMFEDETILRVDAIKIVSRYGWNKKKVVTKMPNRMTSMMDHPAIKRIIVSSRNRNEKAQELNKLSPAIFTPDKLKDMFGVSVYKINKANPS